MPQESLSFYPTFGRTRDRLTMLYQERAMDRVFARMLVPSQVQDRFKAKHASGFCDYPDPHQRIAYWADVAGEHASINDDGLPSAYLSEMDQGLFGGLLGGEVRFLCDADTGWISSMVSPLLEDWSELDSVSFSTEHPWWRRYINQLKVFAQGASGQFGVSNLTCINGLNFAFELFGATKTYLALDECPELVSQAISLAHDMNLHVQETFFDVVTTATGGTFSFGYQWMPGRIIAESVDPFHMTSVDCFEAWGRGPIEKLFGAFDGGVTHLHGNGRHLLEAVASVKGLKALYMGDDAGFPTAFSVLPELRNRAGDLPLICTAPFEKFSAALDANTLVGGVFYIVEDVPDETVANRTMESVRKHHI